MNVREKGSALAGSKRRVRAPLTAPKGLLVQTRRQERSAGKRTEVPAEQIPGYYLG